MNKKGLNKVVLFYKQSSRNALESYLQPTCIEFHKVMMSEKTLLLATCTVNRPENGMLQCFSGHEVDVHVGFVTIHFNNFVCI